MNDKYKNVKWLDNPHIGLREYPNGTVFLLKLPSGKVCKCKLVGNLSGDEKLKGTNIDDGEFRIFDLKKAHQKEEMKWAIVSVPPIDFIEQDDLIEMEKMTMYLDGKEEKCHRYIGDSFICQELYKLVEESWNKEARLTQLLIEQDGLLSSWDSLIQKSPDGLNSGSDERYEIILLMKKVHGDIDELLRDIRLKLLLQKNQTKTNQK